MFVSTGTFTIGALALFASGAMASASANLNTNDSAIVRNQDHPHFSHFMEFIDRFQKRYPTIDEWQHRLSVFSDNYRTILRHRLENPQPAFQLGVTPFADLTADEFKQQFASSYKPSRLFQAAETGIDVNVEVDGFGCTAYSEHSTSLPSSIDWRAKGAVSSVKDQGQCGSCWAFSSTGAMESAWAIQRGELIDLSEQELVDCATGVKYGSNGCNGGQMDGGFKYVIMNGQCSAVSYPYTSGGTKTAGKCASCEPVVKMSGCRDVASKDTNALLSAVAKQPVAVAIEADTRYFQLYTGGILDASTCGTNLDHGVLIVGYGEENGKKYWLVKNSWSSSWGENGYVRILRSSDASDAGICGIALEPSFPVV